MSDCKCEILRGDVFLGPPMNADGKGYGDNFGWGVEWGVAWGGFDQPMQPAGLAGAPASRYIGNANLSWTPNFLDIPNPVRYSLSTVPSCATKVLDSISVSLTAYCRALENQKMEMGSGDDISVVANVVTDEVIYPFFGNTLQQGTLIPFAKAPFDSIQTTVVRKKRLDLPVSYTDMVYGVDYEYGLFGIKLLKAVTLLADEIIIASYTSLPNTVNDGYNDCPIDCSLLIEAKNIAEGNCSTANGQMYSGKIGYFFPRVRLTPTGTRTMFSESEFQPIQLEGEALPVWLSGKEVRMRQYRI